MELKDGVSNDKAISFAIENNSLLMVKILIEHGTKINECLAGLTPLGLACYRDRYEIAKYLLEQGADPNKRFQLWNSNPLLIAAYNGSPKVVELLLKNGADAKYKAKRSAMSRTALGMLEARKKINPNNNSPKVIEEIEKLLLDAGAEE